MQRINNFKFKSLVTQLKNIQIGNLINKLESVQPNSSFEIKQVNSDYEKLVLSKLFHTLDKINISNDNLVSNNRRNNDVKKDNKQKTTKSYEKNTQFSDTSNINSINKIIQTNPDFSILSTKKIDNKDNYSLAFFRTIDSSFRLSQDERFNIEYIKKHKIKAIDVFNKQGFYKKFSYSSKDFKKSDLENAFAMNLNISLTMIKVYANIFRINFVYKNVDDNVYSFMTRFEPNNATFLMIEDRNHIYTIFNKKSTFIRGSELSSLLNLNIDYSSKSLEKLKLEDLQNIAKMKNKDIKKQGKTSKINKTKEELIQEITTQ